MKKNVTELTDEQVESVSHDELKQLYKTLRDHHAEETEKLWEAIMKVRAAVKPPL